MKKAKDISDLVKYIEEVKSVETLEDDDIECLKYIGYVNLITPYKHFFHNGKNCGKHVYSNKVNFSEYLKCYNEDLEQSKIIREVIYAYEKLIKSFINISLSTMYSDKSIEEVKRDIILKIKSKQNYYKNEMINIEKDKGLEYKFNIFNSLLNCFENEKNLDKPYYLIVNQFEFSHIKTFLEIYKLSAKEVKYFNNNFRNIRILRNSLSHGDTIQMHLNRLDETSYKKTLENIKKLNQYNLNTEVRIKYNLLNSSYKKYHI